MTDPLPTSTPETQALPISGQTSSNMTPCSSIAGPRRAQGEHTMRIWRAHNAHIELVWEADIADESAPPGQQRRGLQRAIEWPRTQFTEREGRGAGFARRLYHPPYTQTGRARSGMIAF